MKIQDGTGSSREAGVNDENRLLISGIIATKEHHSIILVEKHIMLYLMLTLQELMTVYFT